MSSKVASKSSKASGAKNGKTGPKSLNSKSKSKSKTNGESSKQSKSKKSQENKGIKSNKPVSKTGQVNNKGSKSLKTKTKTKPSHNGNKNNSKSNLKSNSKSKSSVSKKVQAYNAKSQSSKGNGKKNTGSNNRNPKNSKNSKIDKNNNKNGKNNNKNGVSKSTDTKKKSKEQKSSKKEKESMSNIRVSDEKEDEKERESNKNSPNNNSKLDTSPQAAAAKWRQTAKFAARKQNSQHRLSINESNDNKSIGDIISLFNSKNDNGNDNAYGNNNNNNNSLRNRMSIGSDNSDTGNRFLNVSNHERKLSNMKFRKNNNDSMSSIGEMIEQNDGNNNDDSKNNDNNNNGNNNNNNNNGIRISISSGAGSPSRHFNGIIKPSSVSSNSVSPLNNQLSLGESNLNSNNNNNNSNKSPKWPKSANSPKTTKSPTTTSNNNNNNNKNKNNGSPSNRKNKTDNDEPKRVLSLKERMALLNESKEKDAAHIKPDDKPETKVKPLANVDKNKIANLFNKRINEQMHSNKHDNDNNENNNGSNDNNNNSSHGGNSVGMMMGYNIFGGNPANVSEIIKQKIAEKNLNNQKDNQSLKSIIQSGNIDEMTGEEATEILTNAGFYSKATIVGFNHYGSDADNLLAFNMNNNAIFDRYILKNEKENFENLILKSLSHNNENILQIQMCNCKITDEFFAKVLYILQNNVFGIINDSIGNDSDMNDDEKYDLLNGYKPGIKELWFESNIIGDPGFLALADFIEKDKHIKVIKLMNNKITTISTSVLNRLISAIEKNTCLTTFAYDGFRFSQQKDRFEKCIRRNNDLARKAKQKTFMVKVGQNE